MKTITVILTLVAMWSEMLDVPQSKSRDLIVLIESCMYNQARCSLERVAAFIKGGADPNAKSDGGLPVLQLALANQLSPSVIKLLIKAGADVNGRTNYGETALMMTARVQSSVATEYLRILLNAGSDVNATNNDGWTALMFAIYNSMDPEVVAILLGSGADRTIKNRSGTTALTILEKEISESKRRDYSFPYMEKMLDLLKRLEVPYVQKDVCPGEGCHYGDWIAEKSTPVFAKEGNTSSRILTLKPDEIFTAIRGNVHVTKPGVVLVASPVYVKENTGSRELRLEKGDTIFVLTEYGEGLVNVWHEGELYQIWEFWNAPGSFLRDAKGVLIESPQSEWWVFIKTRKGRFGWIRR